MLRLCHVCASKCISWALAGTAYAAGHKTEMRLSASFEVLSGLIPLRSDHVLSGVASTILDGEVSTVTSLSLKKKYITPEDQDHKDFSFKSWQSLHHEISGGAEASNTTTPQSHSQTQFGYLIGVLNIRVERNYQT